MFEISSKFAEQLTILDHYATGVGIDLEKVIVNLRFDLLDSTDGDA